MVAAWSVIAATRIRIRFNQLAKSKASWPDLGQSVQIKFINHDHVIVIMLYSLEYGIFGERSQISTNQKQEWIVFSLLSPD